MTAPMTEPRQIHTPDGRSLDLYGAGPDSLPEILGEVIKTSYAARRPLPFPSPRPHLPQSERRNPALDVRVVKRIPVCRENRGDVPQLSF